MTLLGTGFWESDMVDQMSAVGSLVAGLGAMLALVTALMAALFAVFPEHVRRMFVPVRFHVSWYPSEPYFAVYSKSPLEVPQAKQRARLSTVWMRFLVTNQCSRDVHNVQLIVQSLERWDLASRDWVPSKYFVPIRLLTTHTNTSQLELFTAEDSRMWDVCNYTPIEPKYKAPGVLDLEHQGEVSPRLAMLTEVSHRGSILPLGKYRFMLVIAGVGGVYYKAKWQLEADATIDTLKDGTLAPHVRLTQIETILESQSRKWWKNS